MAESDLHEHLQSLMAIHDSLFLLVNDNAKCHFRSDSNGPPSSRDNPQQQRRLSARWSGERTTANPMPILYLPEDEPTTRASPCCPIRQESVEGNLNEYRRDDVSSGKMQLPDYAAELRAVQARYNQESAPFPPQKPKRRLSKEPVSRDRNLPEESLKVNCVSARGA